MLDDPIMMAASDKASTQCQSEEIPPSKSQQLISELFRIALCRNDDTNLAASSLIKRSTKKKFENKEKLIGDLKQREEERNE